MKIALIKLFQNLEVKMKTKITLLICAVAILLGVVQITAQTDLKAKIDFIKNEYKAIMASTGKMKVKTLYRGESEEKFVTSREEASTTYIDELNIYRDNGVVRYVTFKSQGEMGSGTISFYFFENKLFFMFDEAQLEDEEGNDASYINRYYLENGKLIQFLKGKAKKDIKPGSQDFKDAQNFVNYNFDLIKPYVR